MAIESILGIKESSLSSSPSKGNSQLKNVKDFCQNIQDYYIYDENGQIIGIDYQKMYNQNKNQIEEFKDLNVAITATTADSFVSQINSVRQDAIIKAETAKKDVKTSNKRFNEIQAQYFDIRNIEVSSAELKKYEDDIKAQIYSIQEKRIDLTKSNSTSNNVIEASRDFQQKVKQLEEDIKTFNIQSKTEENKETVFSIESQEEKYNSKNEIKINDAEENADDLLANNPFWKNATAIFEVEEEVAV